MKSLWKNDGFRMLVYSFVIFFSLFMGWALLEKFFPPDIHIELMKC